MTQDHEITPDLRRAARRLLRARGETAGVLGGIADIVKNVVHEVHHQIRVGKGDQNVDLNLQKKERRSAEDEHYKADSTAQAHEDYAETHAEKHAEAVKKGDVGAAQHHQMLVQHHTEAARHYTEAAEHYKAKKFRKGDAAVKNARPAEQGIASLKRRAPTTVKPAKPPKQPTPPKPQRPTPPIKTPPAPKPVKPAPVANPPKPPRPATPHTPHVPKPPTPAKPPPTPHVPKPPAPKARPTRPPSIRAARPGGNTPDQNDTSGATHHVAPRDVPVRGTINGRNMSTTVHAGQSYHLRRDGEHHQLVMPGLFGKFHLHPESHRALTGDTT